jgi:WD40 repeat protein
LVNVRFADAVRALCFHPTRKILAVVSIESVQADRTMPQGNARHLVTLMNFSGDRLRERRLPVGDVAFSPDGKELILPGFDGTIRRVSLGEFEAASTELECSKIQLGPLRGVIGEAVYGPQGRHVVTANHNGTVFLLRL